MDPSIASEEVKLTPIKLAFNQRARQAEAEVVIGRGTLDLKAKKQKNT